MTTNADKIGPSARFVAVRRLLAGHPGSTVEELYLMQDVLEQSQLDRHEIRLGLQVLERQGEAVSKWSPVGAPDGN